MGYVCVSRHQATTGMSYYAPTWTAYLITFQTRTCPRKSQRRSKKGGKLEIFGVRQLFSGRLATAVNSVGGAQFGNDVTSCITK